MRTRLTKFAAVFLGSISLASALSAQSAFRFEVAAGATPIPESGWPNYSTGVHAQLGLEREQLLGRLGLRADALVQGFRRETHNGPLSPRTTVASGSMSLVLPFGSASARLRPYALAGAGSYSTEYGDGRKWSFGLSGGGGVRFRLGSMSAFVETRIHEITDSSTPLLLPVSFGLRF
jgi:hypothetical protein